MAEKEIKLGDVVWLNSDKRLLMVVGLIKNKEGVARCFWFHNGELKDGLFPLATLAVGDDPQNKQPDEEYTVGDVVRLKSDCVGQQVMTVAFFLNRKRAECFWFHEGEQKVGNCPLCTLTHTQAVEADNTMAIGISKAPKTHAQEKSAKKVGKQNHTKAKEPSSKKKSKTKRGSKAASSKKKRARKASAKKKS